MDGKKPAGLAITSLVLGIVMLLLCCCLGPLVIGFDFVGIILGLIALRKCKKGTGGGKKRAIAGIITNLLSLIYGLIILLLLSIFSSEIAGIGSFIASSISMMAVLVAAIAGEAFAQAFIAFLDTAFTEFFNDLFGNAEPYLTVIPHFIKSVQLMISNFFFLY